MAPPSTSIIFSLLPAASLPPPFLATAAPSRIPPPLYRLHRTCYNTTMSHPIVVKWGKETVEVNLVPTGGVKALKAELEEKTGVPQDRQKIMPKSKGELS